MPHGALEPPLQPAYVHSPTTAGKPASAPGRSVLLWTEYKVSVLSLTPPGLTFTLSTLKDLEASSPRTYLSRHRLMKITKNVFPFRSRHKSFPKTLVSRILGWSLKRDRPRCNQSRGHSPARTSR